MYLDNRKYFTNNTFADEARELHEFLDKNDVPDKVYSPIGNCADGEGNTFYIMPLIDRVTSYASMILNKSYTTFITLPAAPIEANGDINAGS